MGQLWGRAVTLLCPPGGGCGVAEARLRWGLPGWHREHRGVGLPYGALWGGDGGLPYRAPGGSVSSVGFCGAALRGIVEHCRALWGAMGWLYEVQWGAMGWRCGAQSGPMGWLRGAQWGAVGWCYGVALWGTVGRYGMTLWGTVGRCGVPLWGGAMGHSGALWGGAMGLTPSCPTGSSAG